jgi:PAS domain S-box-containing protein
VRRLSPTERDILQALAAGKAEEEVCRDLGLDEAEFQKTWKKLCTRHLDTEPENEADLKLSLLVNQAERHRLNYLAFAAEARLRALLDITPEAVLIVNGRTGIIIRVNQQVEPLFGYTMRQLTGKSVEMLVEEGIKQIHVAYRKGFLSSNRKRALGYHPPIHAIKKSGERIELAIALTSTPGTDEVMVICYSKAGAPIQTETTRTASK